MRDECKKPLGYKKIHSSSGGAFTTKRDEDGENNFIINILFISNLRNIADVLENVVPSGTLPSRHGDIPETEITVKSWG